MESYYSKTVEKGKNDKIILNIQDTTELNFTSQKSKKGLGYIGSSNCSGLMVHTTLSVTEEGVPIGITNQSIWIREEKEKIKERKKIKTLKKESSKWVESLRKTDTLFCDENQIKIMIGDRESDFYDLFIHPRDKNSHLLVRSCQNRLIEGDKEKLFTALDQLELKGKYSIEVGRKKGQDTRIAELTVKYDKFKIKEPRNTKKEISQVELNVILVEEIKSDEVLEPIKWVLLTTLDINSMEDALKYVRWYSYRWLIERYHYVLKSGCQVEDLQLDSGEKIKKALALYSIVACKLLNLTYNSRKNPEVSCEEFFSEREWQILYMLSNKTPNLPKEIPNLKDVVLWIAKLGGFISRKSDGLPGVKTIWRGYRRFMDILENLDLLESLQFLKTKTYG